MTFDSEDDAYKFYNAYARKLGFSIRRCHTKHRADITLSSKYFVCSNEGQKHTSQTDQPRKELATTRSSCKARVQFYISREDVWNVQKVILAHNHSFVSPNKAHMLRSQRHLSNVDKHIISKMREAGVRPAEIYDFFQRWSGGAENVHSGTLQLCGNDICFLVATIMVFVCGYCKLAVDIYLCSMLNITKTAPSSVDSSSNFRVSEITFCLVSQFSFSACFQVSEIALCLAFQLLSVSEFQFAFSFRDSTRVCLTMRRASTCTHDLTAVGEATRRSPTITR
jgi:hypothetical protein